MDISTPRLPRVPRNTLEDALAPVSRVANDLASERFRGAMEDPAPLLQPPVAVKPESAPVQSPTLGDAILTGVNRLSADFQHSWAKKEAALSEDMSTWSAAQLVEFQAHAQKASTIFELMGKGVSKVVQDFEQITKTQ